MPMVDNLVTLIEQYYPTILSRKPATYQALQLELDFLLLGAC
jgi:hypothetical protein